MNFSEALKTESTHTYTENGARALNTTNNACLDLFSTIGALRERNDAEVEQLFSEAFAEDKLLATKILFYARDIREGCGERKVFRTLLRYCATYCPEAIRPNLDLIGVYGRYDDLYELINTPLESDMWVVMGNQLKEDINNMVEGKVVSLLAKWIKTPDAKSRNTRELGIKTAKALGYSVYVLKRILRKLRKYIGVIETYMSTGQWDKINYSAVPSRAMMLYRNAFLKHDEERFEEFTNKALTGEAKINSAALFPYDIVEKVLYANEDSKVLEAQWRQLPNYVDDDVNAIVMADVSGSMYGRPMATSIGLAMYFAEHNKGAYHNLFMTFSGQPTIVQLKGNTLKGKVDFLEHADWGMNTDLKAAFERVLDIAIKNKIPQEEMVKSIIVISDMEIDFATSGWGLKKDKWTFYEEMKHLYKKNGYDIPNIIFWNVDSRNNVFHADADRKGVQLCSGQSATTFKQLMKCLGMTPTEMMLEVINSERYAAIKVG